MVGYREEFEMGEAGIGGQMRGMRQETEKVCYETQTVLEYGIWM
jgi:hypothetical protein